MKDRILVIGGSGFIGTYLLNEIIDFNILNFDKNQSLTHKNITLIGNILNLKLLESAMRDIDSVILLAAEHKDDVKPTSLYYDVNVQGTKNVLKLMDKFNINNLIFTSSVAVYGLNKTNPNEEHPLDPFNHYGKSKMQAEKLIKKWFENNPKKKKVNIIRPTVVFGERNRGNVFNLLNQIQSGKFIMVGEGKNKKSMAYVKNVALFIKDRLTNSDIGFNVFNYSDKPDINMNELVDIVTKNMNSKLIDVKIPYIIGITFGYLCDIISFITNKKLVVSSVRVKKFCATTQFDSDKMHSVFNPAYALKDGLKRTINYEFKNRKIDDINFFSK